MDETTNEYWKSVIVWETSFMETVHLFDTRIRQNIDISQDEIVNRAKVVYESSCMVLSAAAVLDPPKSDMLAHIVWLQRISTFTQTMYFLSRDDIANFEKSQKSFFNLDEKLANMKFPKRVY